MLNKKDKQLHIKSFIAFCKAASETDYHLDGVSVEDIMKHYYETISKQFGKGNFPYDTGFEWKEVMDYRLTDSE